VYEAPAGYAAAVRARPLRRSAAVFEWSRSYNCSGSEARLNLLALWRGALGSPMSLAAFVCGARCAAREPELERAFGTLDVANYTLRGLLRLCKAATVPNLVRVRAGLVEVALCASKQTARHELASSLRLLAGVARAVQLPDVVFGFDSNDYAVPQGHNPLKYASAGWTHVLPGVVRLVAVDSHPVALFPTSPAVRDAGFALGDRELQLQPQPALLDWDAAEASLFWRGGSTGIPFDADFMWHMPRPALGRLARGEAGLDVGMTTSDGVSREMEELGIRELVRFAESVPSHAFSRFKYHIHVDGNTASWGLSRKLHIGALLLWQRSPVTFREYYYELLRPWEHYVPLEPDLSNLLQVRDWLATPRGQAEAREIRQRLVQLVKDRFRPEDMLCYIVRMLHAQSALMDFALPDLDNHPLAAGLVWEPVTLDRHR
jgi:hypothetical protein